MRRYCNTILSIIVLQAVMIQCGGGSTPPSSAPVNNNGAEPETAPPSFAHGKIDGLSDCQQPIKDPGEVWPRIEAARGMSDDELLAECGMPFIKEVAGWRPPPVDLLGKIVSATRADGTLDSWVRQNSEADSRLVEHVIGMDIVGEWRIGEDSASVTQNATRWKTAHGDLEVVQKTVTAAEQLTPLLPKVTAVHELRCQLEVNPLGFAIDCTPIHPARGKIDLTWNAKMRDGHLEDLTLTKCKNSKSCKKLKETALLLKSRYLGLMQEVELLDVEIYREQMKVWLVIPPFK